MAGSDTDAPEENIRDDDDLRKDLDEERQRSRRLLAEFENYRRRVTREQEAAGDAGRRAALLRLLPVLDALEHALAAGSTDSEFFEGVSATHRMFQAALRDAGAEPLATVGTAFDPRIHEAVATSSTADAEPGTVTRELRSGWRHGEDLLRPAQVEVASPPEDETWR